MNPELIILEVDITEQPVDAIVNAANTNLILGSGVAGAIKRIGGSAIQEECKKKSPIKLGEAIETTAGNLPAKYVIHAASMSWNTPPTEESVENSIINSLKIAEKLNCLSIAFPAIGTGVGGMNLEKCAKIMKKIFSKFQSKIIKEIRVVLFDEQAYDVFNHIFYYEEGEINYYIPNHETGEYQIVKDPNKECKYTKQHYRDFLQVGFFYLVLARKLKITDPLNFAEGYYKKKIDFLSNQLVKNHSKVTLFCIGYEHLLHALFLKNNKEIQDQNLYVFNLSRYAGEAENEKLNKSEISKLSLSENNKVLLFESLRKVMDHRNTGCHKIFLGTDHTENKTWNKIDLGLEILWNSFDELKLFELITYQEIICQEGF